MLPKRLRNSGTTLIAEPLGMQERVAVKILASKPLLIFDNGTAWRLPPFIVGWNCLNLKNLAVYKDDENLTCRRLSSRR